VRRIGVDTNVVVSFITDRDAQQQARAAELFAAAVAGESVVDVHPTVILETVYVLCNVYKVKPRVVSSVLRDLLLAPGVTVTEDIHWPSVWALWPSRITDFADACQAAAASAGTFHAVATFDTAFAKRARSQGIATYW
jgi:predicted nucleic-acid-binding protein